MVEIQDAKKAQDLDFGSLATTCAMAIVHPKRTHLGGRGYIYKMYALFGPLT